MEWIRDLFAPYLRKQLTKRQGDDPSEAELEQAFRDLLPRTTATILVQEPFHDSVRFKGLARLRADEMGELLQDPMGFLQRTFGGGKFKVNFHEGWNFVATINFKPQGPPAWRELPAIEY
ncbi:MAG: hypothetical protein HYY96_03550 [Candidatus Tectomicrobia bacterium]|nr:hypothetical protein [Candidatus Tectomicrobia bacterium]